VRARSRWTRPYTISDHALPGTAFIGINIPHEREGALFHHAELSLRQDGRRTQPSGRGPVQREGAGRRQLPHAACWARGS
jgi:hypothetical protein